MLQQDVKLYNRIGVLMAHTKRYSFRPQSRLARDSGLCPSTISRLLRGKCSPSYLTVLKIAQSLETALKQSIDPQDIVSLDGAYPTENACQLVGCRKCAFTGRPEYETVSAGHCLKEALEEVSR